MRSVLLNADEGEEPLSVRDFFQICSVGDGRSCVSFRLEAVGAADAGGRGGGSGSSSSLNVKSMMSGACVCDRVGCELPAGRLARGIKPSVEGESSLLTRPSSSSSSSDISIGVESLGLSFPSTPFAAGFTGEGARLAGEAGLGGGPTGWVAFHSADPNLLSSVCHCPSASTMTSSTSSGVCFRISSKYLR